MGSLERVWGVWREFVESGESLWSLESFFCVKSGEYEADLRLCVAHGALFVCN